MWVCPEGSYDDWYWMLATIILGAEVRVVTNDEMRDHAYLLLEGAGGGGVRQQRRRDFLRWKARHVIHFAFEHGAVKDRVDPELELCEPPRFSVEIQCASREQPCAPRRSLSPCQAEAALALLMASSALSESWRLPLVSQLTIAHLAYP